MLRKLGYSPKVDARRKEAKSSPAQRDEQFRHIERQRQAFFAAGEPVISVYTSKGTDRRLQKRRTGLVSGPQWNYTLQPRPLREIQARWQAEDVGRTLVGFPIARLITARAATASFQRHTECV
jgi:hypothetical protein